MILYQSDLPDASTVGELRQTLLCFADETPLEQLVELVFVLEDGEGRIGVTVQPQKTGEE